MNPKQKWEQDRQRRFRAVQIVAQLPADADSALQILGHAAAFVRFVAEGFEGDGEASHDRPSTGEVRP